MIGETYEKAYYSVFSAVALNLKLQQFSPGARRDITLYSFFCSGTQKKEEEKNGQIMKLFVFFPFFIRLW